MTTTIVNQGPEPYVECLPDGFIIQSEREALELVAACGEHQIHRLLLHAENLPWEFYDLKTGLAGEVLQKFANYSIRVAAVLPEEVIQGRFREMVIEANRGSQFRVFQNREEAASWLRSSK